MADFQRSKLLLIFSISRILSVYSNGEERGILFAFSYMRDLESMVVKYVTISEVKRVCPELGIREISY
jgi:hypothetical protein